MFYCSIEDFHRKFENNKYEKRIGFVGALFDRGVGHQVENVEPSWIGFVSVSGVHPKGRRTLTFGNEREKKRNMEG